MPLQGKNVNVTGERELNQSMVDQASLFFCGYLPSCPHFTCQLSRSPDLCTQVDLMVLLTGQQNIHQCYSDVLCIFKLILAPGTHCLRQPWAKFLDRCRETLPSEPNLPVLGFSGVQRQLMYRDLTSSLHIKINKQSFLYQIHCVVFVLRAMLLTGVRYTSVIWCIM